MFWFIFLLISLLFIFYIPKEFSVRQKEEQIIDIDNKKNLNDVMNEENSVVKANIISDFLSLDAENFEKKYNKNELYDKDILYCDINMWKYHGTSLDGFQSPEEYYDITNITAIRFVRSDYIWGYEHGNDGAEIDNRVYIQYFDNYAISMFFQEDKDSQSEETVLRLIEFSFVKVELDGEIAPESLYKSLEDNYYQVRIDIQSDEWTVSPDGTKAVCISNGSIPKHPSQIFVRYKGKKTDSVFRRNWECSIVGWIDENHIICYEIDHSGPLLIHLETGQVEEIKSVDDYYDTYGAKYEIQDNRLVCKCLGEEIYHWDIVREDNDVRIIKND